MKRCPQCDYPNPENRDTCFKCGFSLEVSRQIEPDTVPEPDDTVTTDTVVDETDKEITQFPDGKAPTQLIISVTLMRIGYFVLVLIAASIWIAMKYYLDSPQSFPPQVGRFLIDRGYQLIIACLLASAFIELVAREVRRRNRWAYVPALLILALYVAVPIVLIVCLNTFQYYRALANLSCLFAFYILIGFIGLWGISSLLYSHPRRA